MRLRPQACTMFVGNCEKPEITKHRLRESCQALSILYERGFFEVRTPSPSSSSHTLDTTYTCSEMPDAENARLPRNQLSFLDRIKIGLTLLPVREYYISCCYAR